MQVKCSCGKVLEVPDRLAGTSLKCPTCGKVFTAGAGSVVGASGVGKITVTCSCGKRLSAPARLAGKKVKCPACGAIVDVPGATTQDKPGFELDTPREQQGVEDEQYDLARPKCPQCGAFLEEGAQFCVACGTHLATGAHYESLDAEDARQAKRDHARSGLVVAIAVAAVLVAGGVTFAVWWFGLREKPQSANSGGSKVSAGSQTDKANAGTESPKAAPGDKQKLHTPPLKRSSDEGYLQTTAYAPWRANAKIRRLEVERAIQYYKTDKGALPKSLDELKKVYPFPDPPAETEYIYDPKTGKVDVGRIRDRAR